MFSPVESLSSLLYSKSSSVVGLLQLGLVFETWKGHQENRIEKLWLWPFHANSNWGTQNFFDSGDLSSILICFIKENICWTLAFDTGSKSNNSTSIETRCHKLLWLDWKIYVKQHNIWSFQAISTWKCTCRDFATALITVTNFRWTQLARTFENVCIMTWLL